MNLTELRQSKGRAAVIFTKFYNDINQSEKKLYCFFEGEDRKYYLPRIEKYTYMDYSDLALYDCEGKDNLLKTYKLLNKNESHKKVRKAFFIDKDYSEDKIELCDIYQTSCYSIENFYTSVKAFQKILTTEFGINSTSGDYRKASNDYESIKKKMNDDLLLLNSWLSCYVENYNSNNCKSVAISGFKVHKLYEIITINELTFKPGIDAYTVISSFENIEKVEETYLKRRVEKFSQFNNGEFSRGKFELEIFLKIIDSLIDFNRKNVYFSEKYTSVNLNPYINPLSSLSHYADTPEDLIIFLGRYKDVSTEV